MHGPAVRGTPRPLSGKRERDRAAVLVGEPGQDVPARLARRAGGNASAFVALDLRESEVPQQFRAGGVSQFLRLIPQFGARHARPVMCLERVDPVEAQLHPTAGVGPHFEAGGGKRVSSVRVEPHRIPVRRRPGNPELTFDQCQRHENDGNCRTGRQLPCFPSRHRPVIRVVTACHATDSSVRAALLAGFAVRVVDAAGSAVDEREIEVVQNRNDRGGLFWRGGSRHIRCSRSRSPNIP